jgi:hypothetical protein
MKDGLLYLILVFGHLLAASMALGAIVATDLRMLSKLAHDKVRIPPPNQFVARLVTIALVLLYVSGAGIVAIGSLGQPDYFLNPKLQGKLLLVALLTVNAFILHRITFPRLARGRSVGRWRVLDWIVVVLPISLSNCLWLFCAFLGIARPWNHAMPLTDLLGVAATLYALSVVVVTLVLAAASRKPRPGRLGAAIVALKRSLASVGNLGREADRSPRARASPRRRVAARTSPQVVPIPLAPLARRARPDESQERPLRRA